MNVQIDTTNGQRIVFISSSKQPGRLILSKASAETASSTEASSVLLLVARIHAEGQHVSYGKRNHTKL